MKVWLQIIHHYSDEDTSPNYVYIKEDEIPSFKQATVQFADEECYDMFGDYDGTSFEVVTRPPRDWLENTLRNKEVELQEVKVFIALLKLEISLG